ncbi:nucleoside deaminase [Brevundimonas sp.]|uniref:nucleoside deaminase n=1 Tax=Brevundimonas sp. TaxID=1871086 RepID=UPI0028A018E6|nr:nucleoside deaminase [Brevundimonas sp.]
MTDTDGHRKWLDQAVDLAMENVAMGGRPFGAVLVREGQLLATGVNRMLAIHDPSSHAEMEALRKAGADMGTTDMSGAVLYASGQPCPMCLAAAYMTGVSAIYYVYDNADAEPFGFSSQATYDALGVDMDRPAVPMSKVDLPGRSPAALYKNA